MWFSRIPGTVNEQSVSCLVALQCAQGKVHHAFIIISVSHLITIVTFDNLALETLVKW